MGLPHSPPHLLLNPLDTCPLATYPGLTRDEKQGRCILCTTSQSSVWYQPSSPHFKTILTPLAGSKSTSVVENHWIWSRIIFLTPTFDVGGKYVPESFSSEQLWQEQWPRSQYCHLACEGVGREGLSLQAQLGDTSTGLRTAFSFHRRMLDLAEGTGCLQYYHCDKGPFSSREISRLCLCYLPHPVCLENKSLRGRLSQSSLTDSLICPSHEETN